MNDRIQDPQLSVRSSSPCSLHFPCHLSVCTSPSGASEFMQQLPLGYYMWRVASGKTALGVLPLNPHHSHHPAGCQQLLVPGGGMRGQTPRRGDWWGLVCRGGFLCNNEKLVACSCFLLKVPPSPEPREARGSWKKVQTRLTQCGRVPPLLSACRPPLRAGTAFPISCLQVCWPDNLPDGGLISTPSLLGQIARSTLPSTPRELSGQGSSMRNPSEIRCPVGRQGQGKKPTSLWETYQSSSPSFLNRRKKHSFFLEKEC